LEAAIGASLFLTVSGASAAESKHEEVEAKSVTTAGEAKEDEKGEEKKEQGEEGRLPLSFTERPLTLPRLVLNPLAELSVAKDDDTFVNLGVSAAFGITDDIQLEATPLPFQLSPTLKYGQAEQPGPSLGATFRFLKGSFELGAHADATLVTYSPLSGGIVRPGIPARIHIGKSVRIDAAAYLPIYFIDAGTGSSTTTVGLQVPLAAAFDIIEPIHVGMNTGARIDDLKAAGNTFAIPFGLFAGYAIGGKDGPLLDIDPFFRWSSFATPALSDPNADKFNPGRYQVGVEVGGFLYL
jgi:hypothetical protein